MTEVWTAVLTSVNTRIYNRLHLLSRIMQVWHATIPIFRVIASTVDQP